MHDAHEYMVSQKDLNFRYQNSIQFKDTDNYHVLKRKKEKKKKNLSTT